MAMLPSSPGGGRGYRPLAEINVTPLVDVMLVLLVIFMVAAPLMMVGVPVQLPRTSAAQLGQPRKPVIVSVTREGGIFLRAEPVPEAELAGRLGGLKGEVGDAVVYVRGDRGVPFGRVMTVLGEVGQAGFAKVSLIAEAASGRAAP